LREKEEQMSGSSTIAHSPVESLLDGFVGYLREERGVAAATIAVYVSDVRRFLERRGHSDIRDVTAAELWKAVLAEVAGWSPATVRRYAASLRAFFRCCQLTGLIETDLSAAVLPVSGRRRSLLPQGISPAQARALLRSCDRRRAAGRRDYAVIVLMLRLGLRAGRSPRCGWRTSTGAPGWSRCMASEPGWTICRCRSMSARR
jgi:site-specific recombinase XerD